MLQPVLATRTRELLRDRSRNLTYDRIAQDTGIGTRWLELFAADDQASPNVNRVEILYTYLNGAPLNV